MKKTFVIAVILVCGSALAQAKKDTTEIYYYNPRWYNISPCGCYTFPKKDSTYTKKDTIKPQLILFNNKTKPFRKKKSHQSDVIFSFYCAKKIVI